MVDKQFSKSLFVLVSIIIGSLDRNLSVASSLNICKKLCSANQTHLSDGSKCLKSCIEAAGSNLSYAADDSELGQKVKRLWYGTTWSKFYRTEREPDSMHPVGPYQRRPHYLRIGRSGGLELQEDELMKRAKPSHYLRIGRNYWNRKTSNGENVRDYKRGGRSSHYLRIGRHYNSDNKADDQIENKRGRPSNYLRIGRGSSALKDDIQDENKRGRPSNYLRIGRDSENSNALRDDIQNVNKRGRPSNYLRIGRDHYHSNEVEDNVQNESKLGRPQNYLKIERNSENNALEEKDLGQNKRGRPSNYLRIGRDSQESKSMEDKVQDESKRSRPSNYLRIGRGNTESLNDIAVDKKAKSSHYLRIGRDRENLRDDTDMPEMEKYGRSDIDLQIGGLSKDESPDEANIDNKRAAMSHYMRIGKSGAVPRESRRSKPSHYLRIGRNSVQSDSGNDLPSLR